MDFALASRGPAFAALGEVDFAAWEGAARSLEEMLPDSPRKAERIHWLIVPLLLWLHRAVERSPRRPVMAGLNAPQGAGKSTLAKQLVPLLETLGVRAVAVSIDDFYLRREDQLELAAEWMLGFTSDPGFEVINEKLAGYETWDRLLDVMIWLRAEDPTHVLRWRADAEDAARAAGRPALSPAEIDDYVRRFLPAYERYSVKADLTLTLDADRLPLVSTSNRVDR